MKSRSTYLRWLLCAVVALSPARCVCGGWTWNWTYIPPILLDSSVLSYDAAGPRDVPAPRGDSGFSPSRAGQPCMDDTACGLLTCDTSIAMGFCTGMCEQASQTLEAAMCGGPGSTCVGIGDGAQAQSFCTKSCRATLNSGCRPGYVCTGFWYTHEGAMPDAPGCMPQCSSDTHCNAGERCNVRTGACGMTGSDPNAIADGMPCTPPTMGQPSPCRGVCFTVSSTDRTRGVCGSFIDLTQTMDCPDDPEVVGALGRAGADNKALCIFRQCSDRLCCPQGMFCEAAMGTEGQCSPLDDPMVPNVECHPDAGSDGGDASDASDVGDGRAASDGFADSDNDAGGSFDAAVAANDAG